MIEKIRTVASWFNIKTFLFFGSAILYTLLLTFESTRLPFLLAIAGLILVSLCLYKRELAILFMFGSLFMPISMQFAGIILRPADFLLGLTFILFIFELFLKAETSVRPFPYHKTIIVFILTAILSLTKANDKWASLSDIIQMVELYVIGGIIFTNTLNDQLLKKLSKLIIFCIAIQISLVVPALIQGQRFWGWMGGNFAFIAVFAGIMAYHAMILFKGKKQLLAAIAFLLICVGLIASATRSSWLALIVGVLIANFFISKRLFKKSLAVLLIVVIILVLAGPNLISSRIISMTDPQFYSNVARIYLMLTAWNAFTQNPITGIGIKNLRHQLADYLPAMARHLPTERKMTIAHEIQVSAGAHNMYFAILGELGLLGFLCIAVLMVLSLRDAYKNYRASNEFWGRLKNSCVFSCLVAFYVMAFFVPGIHVRIECTLFLVLLLSLIELEKLSTERISRSSEYRGLNH